MNLKPNKSRGILAINWVMTASCSMFVMAIAFFCVAAIGGYTQFEKSPIVAVVVGLLLVLGGLALVVAGIGAAISVIKWMRRAYYNLGQSGSVLQYSDSMAVWGWFIPFANLVIPVGIVREIWKNTQLNTGTLKGENIVPEGGVMVGIWWAIYIISNIISSVGNADRSEEQVIGSVLSGISFTGVAIAGFILCQVIRKVQVWENELYMLSLEKEPEGN